MTSTDAAAVCMLIIDDDPTMLRLLDALVTKNFESTIEVETHHVPEEAKDRLALGGVDVLLSDLEMPNISGVELLKAAKDQNPLTQTIMLTGHSTHEALLAALQAGASDYLLKPVNPQDLTTVVGQARDRVLRWRRNLAETWRRNRLSTASTN